MTPLPEVVVELRLLVQFAETEAQKLPVLATHGAYEDHRTAVIGELLGALDRIQIGLGTRLLLAMYPRSSSMWCSTLPNRRSA